MQVRDDDPRSQAARPRRTRLTRGARGLAVLALVCAGGILGTAPGAMARGHAKPHRKALVSCQQGLCLTFFKVDIKGDQSTTWSWPYHPSGGGSCYAQNFTSGNGSQDVSFESHGVVELETYHGHILMFDYLDKHQRAEAGLGTGTETATQAGQTIIDVKPGPCGSLQNPGGGNVTTGCGSYTQPIVSLLTYAADDRHVTLSLGSDPEAIVPLGGQLSGECAPMWTGITGWNEADLYSGFQEDMPLADLMSPRYGKMILVADHTYADPQTAPFPQNTPVTGATTVQWTIDFLRIAHRAFPVASRVD